MILEEYTARFEVTILYHTAEGILTQKSPLNLYYKIVLTLGDYCISNSYISYLLMIENWLGPIDLENIVDFNQIQESSLYNNIEIHSRENSIPSLKDTHLVLLGLDHHSNKIRRHLYNLAWQFEGLRMVDLGNIRKDDANFITPALKEIIDGGIVPIIIGSHETNPIPQFLSHRGVRKFNNISLVSEKLPFNSGNLNIDNFCSPLINQYSTSILNISALGYQTHLSNPKTIEWISKNNFEGVRLGSIRKDIEEAEPVIRDADMLYFQLDALRFSECPAVLNPTPNGLFAEEACQLARYAGMSDKLGSISINGFYPKKDIENQTAQIAAQMIWYFIDGFANRKHDYPVNNSGMTEYVVDYKDFDYQLTFWKSNTSGRWWMQIPIKHKKGMKRHKLIPCSYKDYKLSSNGDLPERLLNALERFS